MNPDAAPADSIEAPRSHELQRDDDVLSLELQRGLESVGTALAVIGVFALVASQLGRARSLVSKVAKVSNAEAGRG